MIQAMKNSGKKLAILSNTSSPGSYALGKLQRFGFDPGHFEGAVTSGEEASNHIHKNHQCCKALLLTWNGDSNSNIEQFLKQCGDIELTQDPGDADLVIAHGMHVMRGNRNDNLNDLSLGKLFSSEDYTVLDPILKNCAARGLPMINSNPDMVVVMPDGVLAPMPGKISARYEKFGGKCAYFGKPHRAHFEACIDQLGLPKERVAHVGDSLHHDIVGANDAGIASVFVASAGVHAKELGVNLGELPCDGALNDLFLQHGITPTHTVPLFRL